MSTSEISGSNELCAQDPEDMTFYNLRGSDKTTILRKKELQRLRKERIENKRFKKKEKIRKAKEIMSTSEISGSNELCAQDPEDMTFYNLRGSDKTTILRKKELQRLRKERIENKRFKKKEKIRKAKEIVDNALKIREELHQKYLRRAEIINQPPDYCGEWDPYVSDDEFGTSFELKRAGWEVEKFALDLARSTVGLESFTGENHLFSCSGIIIEFLNGIGSVVTSASLIRCPDKDEQADELKINVWLPSGEKLEGLVSNVDLYYNICLVTVHCTSNLPKKSFNADTGFFDLYGNHSKDVVALGRICEPWSLKVASGKLIPRRHQFDCEELLVSSCKITKIGVGGPLMDFNGNIIGMNFYDKKGTPFLPSFIVLKCLQHFKEFGKVVQPLHGLRVGNLHKEPLASLEKICHEFPKVCGVIVEKVEPSAEHSEIKVGDIITHLDGIAFSNAAEFGGILLDRCVTQMLEKQNLSEDCNQMDTLISLKFSVKTKGGISEATTRTINTDKFTPSGLNRWPLPRPIIVRQYARGVLLSEEWYS
uniref:PDZ domain-containing protein n=1 Tax=Oryza punctata TaxID=4537 RepID=A0A0E0M1M5_ORYPU